MHRVFEKGCGKWVRITDNKVTYTSNQNEASLFNKVELHHANSGLEDFYLYPRTMLAVPVGTNMSPLQCPTVRKFLKSIVYCEACDDHKISGGEATCPDCGYLMAA